MAADRPAPLPIRTFVDRDHERWQVYEVVVPSAIGTHRSLVFETKHAFRRVRDYPAGWDALTNDELLALSWGR